MPLEIKDNQCLTLFTAVMKKGSTRVVETLLVLFSCCCTLTKYTGYNQLFNLIAMKIVSLTLKCLKKLYYTSFRSHA